MKSEGGGVAETRRLLYDPDSFLPTTLLSLAEGIDVIEECSSAPSRGRDLPPFFLSAHVLEPWLLLHFSTAAKSRRYG